MALSQVKADVIKDFFVLRTENCASDVFSGHSVTSLLCNSTYVANDITVLAGERAILPESEKSACEGCGKLKEHFVMVFPYQILEKIVDK